MNQSSPTDKALLQTINFDILPDEIILDILLKISDFDDLKQFCQTNPRIAAICQDEHLWKKKFLEDFGLDNPLIPIDLKTWKEKYQRLYSISKKSPQISAGLNHYGMIGWDGILYMAGDNTYGQLGDGSTTNHSDLRLVEFKSKVKGIYCGEYFTVALLKNNKTYVWGKLNNFPMVKPIETYMVGLDKVSRFPTEMIFSTPLTKLGSGNFNLVAINKNKKAEIRGLLSDLVTSIDILDISSGKDSHAIIDMAGNVRIVGIPLVSFPSSIGPMLTVRPPIISPSIMVSKLPTMPLFSDGPIPAVRPPTISPSIMVSKLPTMPLHITRSGFTGGVRYGELMNRVAVSHGHSEVVKLLSPGLIFDSDSLIGNQINIPEKIVQISMGSKHILALSKDGNVYSRGDNYYHQLGHSLEGYWETRNPIKIPNLRNISYISSGYNTSAAITFTGELYMWGNNKGGKILDSAYFQKMANFAKEIFILKDNEEIITRPVLVKTKHRPQYVSIGLTFTVILSPTKEVEIWGNN